MPRVENKQQQEWAGGQKFPYTRGATFVVAAVDASEASRNQADWRCTGTADDVDIAAAIAALPSGGGRLVFSEGSFVLAATIEMPIGKPVVIEGQGPGTVFSGAVTPFKAEGSGSIGHTFANFVIDGCTAGFNTTFLSSVLWQNVEVKNCGGDAFGKATGALIVDGKFINCIARDNGGMGFGIGTGSERCDLIACLSEGNGTVGFTFDGAIDSNAIACVAKGNGTHGMELDALARRCKYIGGSSIDNTGQGVDDASSVDSLVLGVAVNGNTAGQINHGSTAKIRDCPGYAAEGDIVTIKKVIDHAALTDGGDATAYKDFTDTIPAGSIIKAVKCDFTEAFNSDDTTTLTMMIGIQGSLDDFNKTADPGEEAFNHTTDVYWGESACQDAVVVTAAAPRVTFTEDDDGTDIINSANAAGVVTISITYMKA